MTSLQVLALVMPFALLALVLVMTVITRWQDKREEQRNAR